MTDFATLVLGADARGLKEGTQALDTLATTAAKTEDRVTKSARGMSNAADLLAATVRAASAAETVARLASADAAQKAADRVQLAAAARAKADQLAADAAARAAKQEQLARDAAAASYASLRASLDPVYAASMRYSQAVDTVEAAVAAGVVTQAQANRVLTQAERAYLEVAPAAKKAEAAVQSAGREMQAAGQKSGNMGFAIQNTAYQIADFFVMVEGGISPMRALATQLPQMLGFFGPWAAGLGAAIAAGSALVPMLFDMGAEAKKAGENLDLANDALAEFQTNSALAMTSADELTKRFGQWGDQIAFNARMMAQQNIVSAQVALSNGDMVAGLGDVARAQRDSQAALADYLTAQDAANHMVAGAADAAMNAHDAMSIYNADMLKASSALGLTVDQALTLNNAMEALRNARGPAELANAANAALAVFHALPPEVIATHQALADAEASVFQLAQNAAQAAVMGQKMNDAFAPVKGILDGIFGSDAPSNWLSNALNRAGLLAVTLMDAARAYAAADLIAANPVLTGPAGMATGESPEGQHAAKLAAAEAQAAKLMSTLGQVHTASTKAAGGAGKLKEELTGADLAAKKLADTMTGQAETAATGLADAFGDFIASGYKDFDGFIDAIGSGFKRLLSSMASDAAANPIRLMMGMTQDDKGAWSLNPASKLGGLMSGFNSGFGSVASGLASDGLGGAGSAIKAALMGVKGGGVAGFGTALGALAGPIAAIGLAFSALKTKTTQLDAGINVTVNGMTAAAQTYETVRKESLFGLIKRTSTSTSGADAGTSSAIQQAVTAIQDGVTAAAASLGIAGGAFSGFAYDLSVSTKGMTQDQALAAVQAKFAEMGDAFAGMVPGLAALVKTGEGASDALTRLATAAQAVNQMADTLGLAFDAIGLRGAAMASDLADIFGGVDAMASASSAYYQAFYSDAERLATTTRQASEAVAALGLSMPTSRDGFRALVEAQDLSTASGRKAFAALVQLSGAMDQILPAVASMTAAISALVGTAGGQLTDLISQTGTALSAAKSAASSWYQAAAQLRSYIADLRGASSDIASAAAARSYNEARFQTALAAAMAGSKNAYADLTGIAGSLLDSTKVTAKTGAEAALQQARVIADLTKAAGAADIYGAQKDVTADLLQKQVDLLTQVKDYLAGGGAMDGAQIDALNGQLGSLQNAIEAVQAVDYASIMASMDVTLTLADHVSDPKLRELLTSGTGEIDRLVNIAISAEGMTPAERWLALNVGAESLRTIRAVMASDADPVAKALGLAQSSALVRTVTAAVDLSDLSDAQRAFLSSVSGSTSGTLTLGGSFEWNPSTGFQTWLESTMGQTVAVPIGALNAPMVSLRTSLDALAELMFGEAAAKAKAAADAKAAQEGASKAEAERLAKIADLSSQAAAYQQNYATGVTNAQNIIGEVRNVDRLLSPDLRNAAGGLATLAINANGSLNTDLAGFSGGNTSTRDRINGQLLGAGGWLDQIKSNAAMAADAYSKLEWLREQVKALGGVPAFAAGGFHTGGVRIVGEHGPEIEATGPARYYSASQTKAMLSGDDGATAAEIRALREEMRRALEKDRATQERMQRTMDQWSVTGLPTRTI